MIQWGDGAWSGGSDILSDDRGVGGRQVAHSFFGSGSGLAVRCVAEPVRSRNSDVRQLRLSSTLGVGKERLFRSTAMERNPGFQRRPGTRSPSPLGGRNASGHLHTPHEEARQSGQREVPAKVRPLCGSTTAASRPVAPGTRFRPPHGPLLPPALSAGCRVPDGFSLGDNEPGNRPQRSTEISPRRRPCVPGTPP